MISGWAGAGLLDSAILMPTPEQRIRLRAGGYPIVKTLSLIVPFPTREIEERQLIQDRNGVDVRNEYGWEILFLRTDAYGAAICELRPDEFPLLIETCPHVMVASDEPVADATVQTIESPNRVIAFTAEPACVGLAVVEE